MSAGEWKAAIDKASGGNDEVPVSIKVTDAHGWQAQGQVISIDGDGAVLIEITTKPYP